MASLYQSGQPSAIRVKIPSSKFKFQTNLEIRISKLFSHSSREVPGYRDESPFVGSCKSPRLLNKVNVRESYSPLHVLKVLVNTSCLKSKYSRADYPPIPIVIPDLLGNPASKASATLSPPQADEGSPCLITTINSKSSKVSKHPILQLKDLRQIQKSKHQNNSFYFLSFVRAIVPEVRTGKIKRELLLNL